MAAPRSRSAQAATLPNYAPFIAAGAVILGIIAALLRLPGALVTLILLVVAGFASQPPQLTGKKDSSGYPTVGNPGEGKRLTGHRMWNELRWRYLIPNTDWMFNSTRDLKGALEQGKSIAEKTPVVKHVPALGSAVGALLWLITPTAFVTIAALGAAVSVYTIPADALALWFSGNDTLAGTAGWIMWPNALAAYLLIQQTFAVRRRYASDRDPMPAITPAGLRTAIAAKGTHLFVPVIVSVVSFIAGAAATTVALNGFGIAWLISPWQVTAAGVGILCASFTLRAFSLPHALDDWRNTVAQREAWDTRWETLKIDPAPYMTRHKRYLDSGDSLPIILDTFQAPGSLGSAGIIARGKKGEITQALGGGTFVQVLNEPDKDSQGQPIAASRAPLEFSILTWPADVQFNILDPDVDQELFGLLARAAGAAAVEAETGAQLMLDEITLISTGDEPDMGEFHEGPTPDPGVAWAITWTAPAGSSLGDLGTVAGAISERFGVEAIPDPEQSVIFVGNLTDGTSTFVDDSINQRLIELDREANWRRAFEESGKTGDGGRAYIQHPVYSEHKTADGQTIMVQPFMTGRGLDPLEFAMNAQREAKLATALDSPAWLSIQSWQTNDGRPGNRHPGAFRVLWSSQPIAGNPALLKQIPRQFGGNQANYWILQHMVNIAFDSVRLARPEVVTAKPLTAPGSPRAIWDIHLRLFGAVTLADVKKNIAKIRNAMGATPWVRVTAAEDGCRIIAGELPTSEDVDFPSRREEELCTALNWEQAFSDAKVSGPNGESPQLVSAEPMPANPKVKSIIFRMPPGISRETIRGAKKTLMPATGNVYLEDEAGPTPDTVKLITCGEQPVPFPAPFDWDAVDQMKTIPFASGVTGEPIAFDVKESAHAIILGSSGSGKAQPLDARIPVPVSERFPNGWATVGSLREGDEVFDQNGNVQTIHSFSDTSTEDVYVLTFDDGQEVRTSGHHAWRVWTDEERQEQAPCRVAVRSAAREARLAEADRLDAIAAGLENGLGMSVPQIAQLAGYTSAGELHQRGVLAPALKRQGLIKTTRAATEFRMNDVLAYMFSVIDNRGAVRMFGRTYSKQELSDLALSGLWLDVRSITEALLGRPSTRAERRAVKGVVERSSAEQRPGFMRTLVDFYPADEIVRLLARRERDIATRHHADPVERIVHSEDMLGNVLTSRGAKRYAIDLPEPFGGPDADLPLDPYVFGAWLGDGSADSPALTSIDPEIAAQVEDAGFTIRRVETKPGNRASTYHFDNLWEKIAAVGLSRVDRPNKFDKRIPAEYLRASKEQRLALLQGLLDTDGTISEQGNVELTLTKKDLSYDALELIRSLGIKTQIHESDAAYTKDGERHVTGIRYRMTFTTSLPVFRLPRHAARLPETVDPRTRRLYVTDVRIEKAVPQRCLRVSGADHLYLTGGFVPTHNSALLQNLVSGAIIKGADVYVGDPTKAAADFQFMKDYIKAIPVTEAETSAMMDHIYDEVKRRKNMNSKYEVASYTDLPDDVRPPHVYVFIDEFTSLMATERIPKLPPNATEEEVIANQELEVANNARRNIGDKAGRLVREARSAGVTLVLAGQELKADTMPGGSALKNNSSSILLGKTSFGSRQSALKDPLAAPELGDDVPKGRGLFESPSSSAQVIQCWYDFPAHEDSILRHIAEVRDPLTADEKVDLASKVKKVETGPVFGRIIDAEPEDEEDEEVIEVAADFGAFDFGNMFGGAPAAEPSSGPAEFILPVIEDETDDNDDEPEPFVLPVIEEDEDEPFVLPVAEEEAVEDEPLALPFELPATEPDKGEVEPTPLPFELPDIEPDEPLPFEVPVVEDKPVEPLPFEMPKTLPVVTDVPEFDWDDDDFGATRKPVEDGF